MVLLLPTGGAYPEAGARVQTSVLDPTTGHLLRPRGQVCPVPPAPFQGDKYNQGGDRFLMAASPGAPFCPVQMVRKFYDETAHFAEDEPCLRHADGRNVRVTRRHVVDLLKKVAKEMGLDRQRYQGTPCVLGQPQHRLRQLRGPGRPHPCLGQLDDVGRVQAWARLCGVQLLVRTQPRRVRQWRAARSRQDANRVHWQRAVTTSSVQSESNSAHHAAGATYSDH